MSVRGDREQVVRDRLWMAADLDTAIAEEFPDAPMPELAHLVEIGRARRAEELGDDAPDWDEPDLSAAVEAYDAQFLTAVERDLDEQARGDLEFAAGLDEGGYPEGARRLRLDAGAVVELIASLARERSLRRALQARIERLEAQIQQAAQ